MTTSSFDAQQLSKAINALNTTMTNLSKSLSTQSRTSNARQTGKTWNHSGGTSTGNTGPNGNVIARRKRSIDDEYHRTRRTALQQHKSAIELMEVMSSAAKRTEKMYSTVEDVNNTLSVAFKQQNELVKIMTSGAKASVKFQNEFQKSFEKSVKSVRSLDAPKLQGTSTGARASEITNIQEAIHGVLIQSATLKAGNKVTSLSQMSNSRDLQDFAKSMGEAGMTINGMEVDKFNQRLDSHDNRIRQKKREVQHAYKHKKDPAEIAKLKSELLELKDNRTKFLENTIVPAEKSLDDFQKAIAKSAQAQSLNSSVTDLASNSLKRFGVQTISATSAALAFVRAGNIIIDFSKSLAKQQQGGNWSTIGLEAAASSASAKAMSGFYKNFGVQVTQLGMKHMSTLYRDNKRQIEKMGYFGDEAIEIFGDIANTLVSIGINPKDTKRFSANIKEYSIQAQRMASVFNINAKEYQNLNDQLLNTSESQELLQRVTGEQRATKAKEIIATRDSIATMTGSIQSAQALVQEMQRNQSKAFIDRQKDSMKVLQVSQMLGMGIDGQRLAGLSKLRPDQLGEDDKKFMAKSYMELTRRLEDLRLSGDFGGNEILADHMDKILEGLRSTLQAANKSNMDRENIGGVSQSQIDKTTAENQQSWFMQSISSIKAFTSALSDNPLATAVGTLGAGIAALIALRAGGGLVNSLTKVTSAITTGVPMVTSTISKVIGGTSNAVSKLIPGVTAAGNAVSASTAAASTVASTSASAISSTATVGSKMAAAMSGAGKIFGKLGIVGSVFDAGDGILDLLDGKQQTELSGFDWLSPMRLGMWVGEKINKNIDIYDMINGDRDAELIKWAATPVNPAISKPKTTIPVGDTLKTEASTNSVKINTETELQTDSKKEKLQQLIDAISASSETEQTQLAEMVDLLKILIEAVKPENNGLLEALKGGKSLSFAGMPATRDLVRAN